LAIVLRPSLAVTAPAQAVRAVLAQATGTSSLPLRSATLPTLASLRGATVVVAGGPAGARIGVVVVPPPPPGGSGSGSGSAGQSSRRSRSVTGGGIVITAVRAASCAGSAAEAQPSLVTVTT
jgi:hypothetical protein